MILYIVLPVKGARGLIIPGGDDTILLAGILRGSARRAIFSRFAVITRRRELIELIDRHRLKTALRHMGTKHLRDRYRDRWTPDRPTTGYCYVVTEVLYHFLAPDGYRPHVMKTGGDDTHWFLKGHDGEVIDLTDDQFDYELDYSQGKPQSFRTREISERGQVLAELIGLRTPIR